MSYRTKKGKLLGYFSDNAWFPLGKNDEDLGISSPLGSIDLYNDKDIKKLREDGCWFYLGEKAANDFAIQRLKDVITCYHEDYRNELEELKNDIEEMLVENQTSGTDNPDINKENIIV